VPGLVAAPRLVLAVAVGVAAVVAVVLAARSSGATGPALVRLTDVQTNFSSFGPDVGGGEIARVTLFGSRSTKKAIGHGVLLCTYVGANERSCHGSYVLPRGTLETAGLLKSRLIYMHAIVGGTGLYDNARGTLTVTAKALRPRREILVFRLTG
jgi:hypothetical protein